MLSNLKILYLSGKQINTLSEKTELICLNLWNIENITSVIFSLPSIFISNRYKKFRSNISAISNQNIDEQSV